MFKKSAPVLLLGGVMLAVSCASMAQDKGGGSKGGTSVVPTVAGSGKVTAESLVQRYQTLAGTEANANSLVNGLRNGTAIDLTATIQEQVKVPVQTQVTETVNVPFQMPAPPPAPPGTFITIFKPQAITRTVTTYRIDTITRVETTSITPPTGSMGLGNVDIALALTQAVFTQKNIATPAPKELETALTGDNGILTLRAKKMGWGEIANLLGFEVK